MPLPDTLLLIVEDYKVREHFMALKSVQEHILVEIKVAVGDLSDVRDNGVEKLHEGGADSGIPKVNHKIFSL